MDKENNAKLQQLRTAVEQALSKSLNTFRSQHHDIEQYLLDEVLIRNLDDSEKSKPNPDTEWTSSQHQCPYCEAEFDGHPIKATKVYRRDADLSVVDTICSTCRNDARMHELTTLDFTLYDAKTRPTHLIRWEYFPSEWNEMWADPHGFYSNQWVTEDGHYIEEASPSWIFGAHQAQDQGWRRLPIAGMSVTARIFEE
jgi:hypothetical protein